MGPSENTHLLITNYNFTIMPAAFKLTAPEEKALLSGFFHSSMLNTLLLGQFISILLRNFTNFSYVH